MSSRVEIILENTPFPGAGQEIGGHRVIESMVDVEGKNWAVYIKGKLSQSQVKSALAGITATHFALPVQDEFSLVSFKPKGMTHARTNPPGDVTVVRGHMYYARPNPISKSAFHEEMDEMLIDNPEKHFTKYTVKSKDALHERLWKGVSYAGESYGWKKGDELWHRRASFIMPKIKINKALKGATMFYHTHPSKDEPSLTSADDIQFYLDLHFAWGIKSFYTIMKHKLDHFTITGKPGGAEKYLRMEEDAFIDTVDGMIGKGEEVAKKEVGDDRPEVEFQNRITKEMVDLFNKKFKSIAKISFRPKAKNTASKLARKPASNPLTALVNPAPNPPIKVKDQYVAKALEELKGLDYAHEHYGADEYGHTMYVYWWLKHHLAPTDKQPKGRLFKLNEYGLDSDTRKKLRSYLSQPIIGNYNYMDAVYLLALYHDIAKLREKGVKEPGWEIGAEMFRNEIGPELNLPSKLTEDLAFLFDTDLGRKGIADEDFLTQSGDYYGASKLVQMADMITHHPTMYTKKGGQAYKQEAMVSMVNQLRVFLDHHYVIQNPPPQVNTLQWVSDYGIEEIPYGVAEELLGEFHQSVIPDNDGKTKQPNDKSSGGHIYYMRFNNSVIPGLSRTYSANLALSSSKLTIFVGSPTPDDLGKKVANDIYQLVGSKLQESYFEIELEVPAPEVLVNPRHANKIQIISISGPSGGGKSTLLRYLSKHIPNSSTPPTYTTRPQRRSDGPDRKFVSKTQFKSMLKRGEFVEYTVSANGHYYGRRFKDFLGNVAIIEVSLQGKKDYEKRFANMFTVYLDPDPKVTEEQRAKDIFKRGGLTKEEAKRRAKKATELVEKSKKMQFDLRVTMLKGKYNEGAKKVLSEVPLVNPRHTLDVGISQEEQEAANRAREERIAEAAAEAAELAEQFPQGDMDVGITREEQEEGDRLLAENKERIAREEEEEAERIRQYEESLVQDALPIVDEEEAYRDMHDDAPWANPKKDLFDWFEDWAKLINMKNKELKAFLDSDWGKVAGLSPQEAKKLGINSGRTSGRRILAMRKKLGLGGPKDYIKGPRHLEDMYAKAIDKWTGPATKKGTDWYWCTRQVRFNKRFMGDNFGERKGPLVKKQKTQNQPSRRLLSLWVWGHDPWRYARKNGVNRMPKCPDVPWVGRTEKIKYGKIEVIQGPRKNPVTSITLKEIMESETYRKLLKNVELRMKRKKPPASANEWEKLNNIWYNLEEFGYTGKSPERALEAIFNWHKKYVKSGEVKIYRAVVIPPDWERLERAWNSRGVGDSWSVLKQGADNYMSQNQFLQAYPVSEIAFVEGRLRFGDIDWDYTIRNNITWGTKEAELNPHTHAKVFVDKVSFYKLDDSASEKYLKGLVKTTGKTNKPWLGRKNKPFLVVEPKKAYTSYIFPNPRPNPEFWGDEGSGILVVAADTKRILLGLRSEDVNEPLTWGNFGGAIGIDDYGNKEEALSPLKNALKEMKEEIGYSGKITPYKSYTFKSESFIYHNFIGVVPKESMVKLDKFNWEVSELRWFTMEEVNQLPNLHFGLRSLLENTNPLYSIPIMANPPSRVDQFTKQDIVWTGTLEKGLSANLLKAIKKLRHQNREYFGYANNDTLWSHTNFEPTSAGLFEDLEDKKKFIKDNGISLGFHTHPIMYLQSVLGRNKWSRWVDVPSPADYAFTLQERLIHGIQCQIVSTQHGFFIIEALPKEKSFSNYTQEIFEHDKDAAKGVWDHENVWDRYGLVLTPGQHAQDTVKEINKRTKLVKFKVTFYDDPIIAVKWKPHKEEEDWVSFDKGVKVNPHYSPPPRSKPFPWNKNRVKKSPFKTMKKAQATYDLWKKGKAIGFSANSSLKSMGKIPRASGKYEVSYVAKNPPLIAITKGWHVTKTEFVPSIMKNGLLMGRPGLSPLGYNMPSNIEMANYMHKTPTKAMQFAKRREEKHGPQSIIEVDLQPYSNADLGAEPSQYTRHPDINERFLNSSTIMITQDIPPSGLSVVPQKVIDDFWREEEEARGNLKAMNNPPEEHIHWDEYHSHMTDYHVDERQNPPWPEDAQVNPHIMMTEPWSKEQVPIDALLAPLIQNLWDNKQKTWYSDQGSDGEAGDGRGWRGYLILIPPNNYANPKLAALPRSIVRRDLGWEKQFVGKHPAYPKGTKLYQWFDKKNSLKEIYKAFGLVAPSSKTEAERMLENSKAMKNPMAPGYQSYGWTTQDWRSIKVNSKGDIDYSQKCGAEGTRTKSGKPRLCLPAPVIRSLMKTESGKEVLRQQARKKLRAKKGEKVPWHPRIKKLHKKLEENTPEDR